MGSGGVERRLAAIVAADIVGYSRLMAEDEGATVSAVTACREVVERLVRRHRGRLVDFTGDNFLGEFSTATEAVSCAAEIQAALRERNAGVATERRMEFRIGIHLGEVRVEGERIYGDGVNIAARLEGLAEPGGLIVSGAVHEQVRRRSKIAFEDRGPQRLKNIPDPVHVYCARWGESLGVSGQRRPSVAVLPFVNMSPDPDQEYFADGIAEELINALTKVEGLRVIARTSAFSFKGTNADITTIGTKLGVSTIVEGSVRKAGSRLRITAQLVDVAGGDHIWSEIYDRSLDHVFEIQDDIARRIVRTIKPKLLGDSPAPLVKRATASQEAYELYLRAGDRIARVDRRDTRTAIEMLEEATTIDPGYGDAWARLASACCQMETAFEPDGRWLDRAEQAGRRAFELDPANAEAHYAHGRVLWSPRRGFQHAPALRALGEALRLQPGSHEARVWQSIVLFHVGLNDEAREGLEEALSTKPDDPLTLNAMAQLACFGGRHDEAGEHMARAMSADATLIYNHLFHPTVWLYRDDLGRSEEALHRARRILGEDPILDSSEALLWARRGEADKAEEALSRAMQDRHSLAHVHHTWHLAAAAFAVLGREQDAVEKLRAAAASGLPSYPLFRSDPHLAPLGGAPQMQGLLADLQREHAAYRQEFGSLRSGSPS